MVSSLRGPWRLAAGRLPVSGELSRHRLGASPSSLPMRPAMPLRQSGRTAHGQAIPVPVTCGLASRHSDIEHGPFRLAAREVQGKHFGKGVAPDRQSPAGPSPQDAGKPDDGRAKKRYYRQAKETARLQSRPSECVEVKDLRSSRHSPYEHRGAVKRSRFDKYGIFHRRSMKP